MTPPRAATTILGDRPLLSQSPEIARRIRSRGTAQRASAGGLGGSFAEHILLDGSADYVSVPHNADFNFGTGDFTIDCWAKVLDDETSDAEPIATHGIGGSASGWRLLLYPAASSTLISFRIYGTTYNVYITANVDTDFGGWHHIAVVRDGNTLRLFYDGEAVNTHPASAINDNTCSDPLYIGYWDTGVDAYYDGGIEEFRISKGIARWTSAFVPPTIPYDYPCDISSSSSSSSSSLSP